MPDKELVRDVVQDLFVQVWANQSLLPDVQSAKAYLMVAVRRQLLRRTTPATDPIAEAAVQQRVFHRAAWILRQQERFRQLGTERQTARRYVSGETHYYIGRQYRLRVGEGPAHVQLKGGWLTVSTADC